MDIFQFKKFKIFQNSASVFKVNTEAVLLSAWVQLKPDIKILEVGSGTGVISLGLIQRLIGNSKIIAIDIDNNAFELTKKNIEENQIENISVIHSSIQNFFHQNQSHLFDLIISNPPYFDSKYKSVKQRNRLAKYTDSLNYKTLIELSANMLSSNGTIALVVPFDDLNRIKQELTLNQLEITRQLDVTTTPNKKPLRVLVEIVHKNNAEILKETLLIKDSDGNFTEAYKSYTKDYYTIF